MDSGYNDYMLRILLEQNVSREYADKLYQRPSVPDTYQGLVKEFQSIENYFRLMEYREHQSRPSQSTSHSKSQPFKAAAPAVAATVTVQPPSTASGTHAGPMDVSVARGKLSAAERERRYKEHLCMYCAQPDHIARNCPLPKKPKHLRVAEACITSSVPSPSSSPSPSAESENGVSLG